MTGACEVVPRLDVAAHAGSGTVLALPMHDVLLQLQLRLLPAVPGRRDAAARARHERGRRAGAPVGAREWAGHALLTGTIRVGYKDTLTDLLTEGAGALAAAVVAERLDGARRAVR